MSSQFKVLCFALLFLFTLPSQSLFASSANIDKEFNQGLGFDDLVDTIITNNNDIIVGGAFTSYNSVYHNGILRLDINGNIDETFNHGEGINTCFDDEGINNCSVNSLSLYPENKILVGGAFDTFDQIPTGNLVRLYKDGSIDYNFISGSGFNNSIYSLAVEPDGKILVGGNFTLFDNKPYRVLVRLNSDGSIDQSFKAVFNDGLVVHSIKLQNDGKIVIAGLFNNINGKSIKNVARLNHDGSLDLTFNPGQSTNSAIENLEISKDNKIILVGHFTTFNNFSVNYIVRLNEDGSIDKNFKTKLGVNAPVRTVSLDKSGGLIIGGDFKMYNNILRNRFARLKNNGQLDLNFNPGLGFNNKVFTSFVDNDGKILVGGWFTEYDGFTSNRLVRLLGDSVK